MLNELVQTVRLADALDIALVAALFYLGVSWLRRSGSGSAARRMLVILIAYQGIYLLADRLDLNVMTRVLGALFFVVLVAFVVVFQSDIRRLLDRLAAWGGGGDRQPPLSSPLQVVAEAAARLAEHRIGALIALRGEQPWESHVRGGVPLDGQASLPLLQSLFDPDTPGHDGAVLMEGRRITRFAVHLPLGRPPEASRFGGTRHAAGVGLTEACDALVVVVSEERGTISVAENGRLDEMDGAAELAARLEAFWAAHHVPVTGRLRLWPTRRVLGNAGLSLFLALLTWALFSFGGEIVQRTYGVPVELRNVPPRWRVENVLPRAWVTLSGSESAVDRLDPEELAVSLDLSNPKQGVNQLFISDEALRLPSGVQLVGSEPAQVQVLARRELSLELPVAVPTREPLPQGMALQTSPGTIRVLVPEEGFDRPEAIPTEPLDLTELAPDGTVTLRLVLPPEVRLPSEEPARVKVTVIRTPPPATPADDGTPEDPGADQPDDGSEPTPPPTPAPSAATGSPGPGRP